MSPTVRLATGLFAVLVGLVWTGQGLGFIGGSAMTDQTVWALIGPVVAVGGVLLILGARRDRD